MANRDEIKNGDEARDSISGFKGTVIAITEWLNGCVRVTIAPREMKDGKPAESITFDIEQVELIKSSKAKAVQHTGGPHPEPTRNVL